MNGGRFRHVGAKTVLGLSVSVGKWGSCHCQRPSPDALARAQAAPVQKLLSSKPGSLATLELLVSQVWRC